MDVSVYLLHYRKHFAFCQRKELVNETMQPPAVSYAFRQSALGLLTGCGKKNADDNGTPATTQALTAQDTDTMHLNMLFSLISTPDSGVTELLGDGSSQKYNADGELTAREFDDGIVYGCKVTFTVYYNTYGDVTSICILFPKSDDMTEDQLRDTVTELVGRNPDGDEWKADTATVTLSDTEDGLTLQLEQFEADTADSGTQH